MMLWWLNRPRVRISSIISTGWYTVKDGTNIVIEFSLRNGGTDSSTVEVMSAAIFNKNPKAVVRSKTGNPKQAELVENLLNYWYRELNLKNTIKDWVMTSLVMYQGYVKMGYTKKTVDVPDKATAPDGQPFEGQLFIPKALP